MALSIRTCFFCLVALLLASAPVQAQRKGFIQRSLDYSYRIVQGDSARPHKKYFFLVPIFAYKPETRTVLGLSATYIFRPRIQDSITRPSILRGNISYSQNNQFSVRPYVDLFTRGNKWNIRGQYQYTNFAEYYWGIGSNTPESNKEMYNFRMNRVNLKAAYQFLPKLYAGAQVSLENMFNVQVQAGGLLDTHPVAGSMGYFASGAGFTLYFDDRDNVYFPYRGQIIEVSNCYYTPLLGSAYTFSNITIEARKFIQLWRENILGLHAYVNTNSGNVPFRMMGTLGSESYMRGYYTGRLRDNNAMAWQAELRKTVWGPLSVVAFGGVGSVGATVPGLLNYLYPNYGGGIRIKAIPRERMNIRMDVGFMGNGNNAFYLTMNEAF